MQRTIRGYEEHILGPLSKYGSVPITGTRIIQHHRCVGGTRKLSNSSIVHTWSVSPAAMAAVTGFHEKSRFPPHSRLWGTQRDFSWAPSRGGRTRMAYQSV